MTCSIWEAAPLTWAFWTASTFSAGMSCSSETTGIQSRRPERLVHIYCAPSWHGTSNSSRASDLSTAVRLASRTKFRGGLETYRVRPNGTPCSNTLRRSRRGKSRRWTSLSGATRSSRRVISWTSPSIAPASASSSLRTWARPESLRCQSTCNRTSIPLESTCSRTPGECTSSRIVSTSRWWSASTSASRGFPRNRGARRKWANRRLCPFLTSGSASTPRTARVTRNRPKSCTFPRATWASSVSRSSLGRTRSSPSREPTSIVLTFPA